MRSAPDGASRGPLSALWRDRDFVADPETLPADPAPRRTVGHARPGRRCFTRSPWLKLACLHLVPNSLHNRPSLVLAMATKSLPSLDRQERFRAIAKALQRTMPAPKMELDHRSPWNCSWPRSSQPNVPTSGSIRSPRHSFAVISDRQSWQQPAFQNSKSSSIDRLL